MNISTAAATAQYKIVDTDRTWFESLLRGEAAHRPETKAAGSYVLVSDFRPETIVYSGVAAIGRRHVTADESRVLKDALLASCEILDPGFLTD